MTEETVPPSPPESLLDRLLPRFDVRQVREAWVPAAPAVVYSAVKQVTGRDVRALMPLELLRSLPGLLLGRRPFWPDPSAPLLAEFADGAVLLAERQGREVVAGAVGRFWRTAGNEAARVRTSADFIAFSEPGYAKAAVAFTVVPERGGARVRTETRVAGTSAEATRLLRRYWLLIRPGSDVIRRSWLAAIRRRALREAGQRTVRADSGGASGARRSVTRSSRTNLKESDAQPTAEEERQLVRRDVTRRAIRSRSEHVCDHCRPKRRGRGGGNEPLLSGCRSDSGLNGATSYGSGRSIVAGCCRDGLTQMGWFGASGSYWDCTGTRYATIPVRAR